MGGTLRLEWDTICSFLRFHRLMKTRSRRFLVTMEGWERNHQEGRHIRIYFYKRRAQQWPVVFSSWLPYLQLLSDNKTCNSLETTITYISYIHSLQDNLGICSTLKPVFGVTNLFQFNDTSVAFIAEYLKINIWFCSCVLYISCLYSHIVIRNCKKKENGGEINIWFSWSIDIIHVLPFDIALRDFTIHWKCLKCFYEDREGSLYFHSRIGPF